MRGHSSWVAMVLGISWAWAAASRGAEPGDELLRLVPPDAGVTLAVEDLRGHARELLASPLGEGLRQLPSTRSWLASEKFQELKRAQAQIEGILREKTARLRDDLLGDAVVLALDLSAGNDPGQAHGVFLTRVRDRALLERVLHELNEAQRGRGELAQVVDRAWQGVAYTVREFRNGARPNEYYTTLGDATFAWSNSEGLIRGVIERRARGMTGLADNPRFLRVRRGLPKRAAISLFIDPRFLERVVAAAPRSRKPGEEQVLGFFRRYLGAVEYAGASLEWGTDLVFHTEETLDPARLDPWMKRWASDSRPVDPELRRIPARAMALSSLWIDFGAVAGAIDGFLKEDGHGKLENLFDALRGLLLGRDFLAEVLPGVGPGFLAYLESPPEEEPRSRPPLVVAVQLPENPAVARALDNALHTFLALYALDEKHGQGRLRVATQEAGGVNVTALDASSPFAFAIGRGRLVVGSSREAVARSFSSATNSRLERLRATHFAGAGSFACVDLEALCRCVGARSAAIAGRLAGRHQRAAENEAKDLEQVLALLGLFEGGYLTSTVAPGASSIHRTIGLVAKSSAASARP